VVAFINSNPVLIRRIVALLELIAGPPLPIAH
jgi:hypothetical protein